MPELASAWVTLAVRAPGMQRDITRVMEQANRSARLNPKIDANKLGAQGSRAGRTFGERFSLAARIDSARFGAQGDAAGRAFGTRFSSVAKSLMAAGGVTAGAAAVTGALREVMSVGVGFDRTMNNLAGVTEASEADLARFRATARALGNDVDLAGTSTMDAAKAMTELAKAGMSADQAIAASRGTLQLATAAQVDAERAGEIQSNILNAFKMAPDKAREVADVLANADIGSSAGITDVAQAMQQVSGVAKGFGEDVHGTAAAIMMLANAGVKGSDAGTLLKTTLQSITDQGNPAQAAIQELGLELYKLQDTGDMQFVGFRELFRQLDEAKRRMSSEQFQAASNVLFGSDAMRGAMLGNVADFDKNLAKTFDDGAAARMAKAQTRGLPGAIERVSNSLESLKLDVYDRLEGPAERLMSKLSEGIDGLGESWEKLAANPAVQDARAAFAGLVDSFRSVGPALGEIAKSGGKAAASVGGAAWKAFVTTLQAAAGVLHTVTPALTVIAGLMSNHQGLVTAAALAWAGFRIVPEILGRIAPATTAASSAVTNLGQQTVGVFRGFRDQMRLQQSLAAMSGQQISTAGSAWATLAARGSGAMNTLRGATTGVINALGGGLSVALMAGGAAFAYISAQNQKSSQSLAAYQDAVRNTGRAQVELNEALQKSRGAFDDTVKPAAVERIRSISTELEAAAKRTGSFLDKFRDSDRSINPFSGPAASYSDKIKAEADAAKDALKAIDALKLGQQSLSDAAYGSQAGFDAMVGQLEAAGVGGRGAADALRRARTEFMAQQQVAANTAPGVYEMASAMRTLADDTATAADKSNALKAALDALNPARTKADAEAAHTRASAAIQQQGQTPVDAAGGVGDALFKAGGEVNTLMVNGVELNDTLKRLVDATVDVSQNGGDMAAVIAKNEENFAELARRFQTDVPHIKAAFDDLGGTLATYGDRLGGIAKLIQSGQIPTDLPIKVDAPGGKEVFDLLSALGVQVREGNDKTIAVDAPLGKEVEQLLERLHYQAQIKEGKLILVKLDGVDAAKQAIEELKKPENKLIRINTLREAFGAAPLDAPPAPRSVGAIVPRADGGFNGLKWIIKPEDAGLYAGRGAGTIFAEKETGGEAYIPLATSKRGRSTQILSEVAAMFGMQLTAREDGGITPESLRQFASGIAGRPYKWGQGEGDTFDTDCSGAQSTLANFITGGTGRFGTGDEAAALLSRGFQMGDPPKGISAYWIGWRTGGAGGGHTAGTIVDPFNGNVNIEMGGRSGGGQFGGTAAGASMFPQRAWIALAGGDDPNGASNFSASSQVVSASNRVTKARQSVGSAQSRLDTANAELDELKAQGASAKKLAAAEKKRDKAQEALTNAQQRQAEAEDKLATAKEKATAGGRGNGTGELGENLGQSLVSGALQALGLDGSLFMNPFDTPNAKSLMAAANFAGGLFQQFAGSGDGSGGGGLGLPDLKMPGIADLLKTPNPGPTELNTAHLGTGAAPGPSDPAVVINGGINGADPTAVRHEINKAFSAGWHKAGKPR
ncbi:phage tail tape measure protein [Mycolicibacter virginiensis]|uniref:Phage tail tape measure protein n=1 Tax=Mycolicibacter virginiensis TaxID=1795032 RepID=A0A9X7IMT0_9MYCO|nr:phage tail tape measure protein [Mycolicibacter virginiensis]PQM52039.1 phage tail tape measure protein [Mycolicibacter virginiensis]ULP47331.1 phage tail tape measure protein [Mycolicibacter virginiensis]